MQKAIGHKAGYRSSFRRIGATSAAFGSLAFASLLTVGDAHGQTSTINPGSATEAVTSAAAGELTASKIVKDPGAPYENVFRDFDLGLAASPKVGPGRGKVSVGPLGFGLDADTPISRGFRPEDAELKLGNFYLDIRNLTGSVLYTDNANLSSNNRESDVIAAVTLGLTAMYQLTEGLRVAVEGSVIYLPLSNEIGVAGFGISDPFAQFNLDGGTLARAQISYDFNVAGWDAVAYDDFQVSNRSIYRLGDADSADLYNGESFTSEETFRNRRVFDVDNDRTPQFKDTRQGVDRFKFGAIDYKNVAGVTFQNLLPSDLRATAGYRHENYWYSDSGVVSSLTARANERDVVFGELRSERENLRFKPFVRYTASTTDVLKGWDQQVSAGVSGPITDQLFFHGEGGYIWSGNSSRTTTSWRLGLVHVAGPYTVHAIRYSRVLTEPDRVVKQTLSYDLTQILGPYLTSRFFASRSEFENLDVGNSLAIEHRAGGVLNYDIGIFGDLAASMFYGRVEFDNPANPDYEYWTFRLNYGLKLGEKTFTTIFYQYEQVDSQPPGNSYYENLLGASLTRSF